MPAYSQKTADAIAKSGIPMSADVVTDAAIREQIKQALSGAGAFCGECGFEPGDRGCPDCERCYESNADALMPILRPADEEPEPQLMARGLTAKEAMLRLLADTTSDPSKVDGYREAADRERQATIARAQAGDAS
ncbi:hypothetical protein [Streptomyces liliifuscus]|uniref:Uncharacterized protein n=1 Tax=Streptomyces liliifuscus TaxID=2797636 RepID=A0A7T7RFV7_9ACTN|nr:hypothetical protein [Streptomyces liliifuscus]QQM45105.1 hypothetical protein JEQ17_40720 [Streptomyces liliifuscus]